MQAGKVHHNGSAQICAADLPCIPHPCADSLQYKDRHHPSGGSGTEILRVDSESVQPSEHPCRVHDSELFPHAAGYVPLYACADGSAGDLYAAGGVFVCETEIPRAEHRIHFRNCYHRRSVAGYHAAAVPVLPRFQTVWPDTGFQPGQGSEHAQQAGGHLSAFRAWHGSEKRPVHLHIQADLPRTSAGAGAGGLC